MPAVPAGVTVVTVAVVGSAERGPLLSFFSFFTFVF